jgi:hypothetical protein
MEAGQAFREAGAAEMEEEVLALIQRIADTEDVVVRIYIHTYVHT